MQKDANLVELEKCCRTHIFLQNFVLIQPRTSRENEKAIQIKQRAITELTAFMEEAEATLKTLSKEIVDHKAEVQSVNSFTFQ